MKMFPDLIIIEHDGYKSFAHSCDKETLEELMSDGGTILDEENYSADDFAFIFGNELEDMNLHNFTHIGDDFLSACKEAGIEEELITSAIKNFMKKFLSNVR